MYHQVQKSNMFREGWNRSNYIAQAVLDLTVIPFASAFPELRLVRIPYAGAGSVPYEYILQFQEKKIQRYTATLHCSLVP